MPENDPTRYEPDESFNQQPRHCCPHCGHEWEYTGDADRPTCPSCARKVPDYESRIGEPTEFHTVALGAYVATHEPLEGAESVVADALAVQSDADPLADGRSGVEDLL